MIHFIAVFNSPLSQVKRFVLLWVALFTVYASSAQVDVHEAVKNLLAEDNYTYDYTEIGNQLVEDIKNQSEGGYVSYSMAKTYVEGSILPTLEEPLTAAELTKGVLQLHQEKREGYQGKIKHLKDLLDASNISTDDLALYTALPLKLESYMSPENEIVGQQVALFLVGDGSKMLMLLANIITYQREVKILELDKPDTYIDASEGDYAIFYQKFARIFEKILLGQVDDRPSTLFGEKVNEEWFKSTVQIYEQAGLTYVKSMIEDDWEYFVEHEYPNVVFFRMLSDAGYDAAYNLMLEMIAITGKPYYISANKENGLKTDVLLSSKAREVLSENADKGITTASFYLMQEWENTQLCEVKFEITKTKEGKANLDIWILQEL
ncbi:MAG: hypothetical protein R2788_17200 [Saprospiraceae bacterium]